MTSARRAPTLVTLLASLLLLGGACAAEGPRVDEVVPRSVDEGSGAEIVVRGAGFHWQYDSLSNEVGGSFKVRVGDLPLDDVQWIDATELRGRLPIAVRAGRHPVSVDTPLGTDRRDDALLVRAVDGDRDDDDAGPSDGG